MTLNRSIAASLALMFGVLMFVPLIVLGSTINFPQSLDYPAEKILPLVSQQADAVRFGYLSYLLYSVLFFPAIAAIGQALGENPITRMANLFAALSSLARSIGILRWLTVVPALAAAYSSSDPKTMQLVYSAVNAYGGGIGELLGVSLFGAIAIALISKRILETNVVAKWLGGFGYVVAFGLLLPWLEVLGINLGAIISISVTLVQLWFLAVGIGLLLRPRVQMRQGAA